MSDAALALVAAVLDDMGYRTEPLDDRPGLLAENSTRVVLTVVFDGVLQLLRSWEDHQAWLLETARERLTVDKAWEVFLVLACRSPTDADEMRALQGIRRDAAYARKLVVSGLDAMSPVRLRDELAPLEDLPLPAPEPAPDALETLRRRAEEEGADDVLTVVAAYRANQPLFENL
jgi:hypothetical protein